VVKAHFGVAQMAARLKPCPDEKTDPGATTARGAPSDEEVNSPLHGRRSEDRRYATLGKRQKQVPRFTRDDNRRGGGGGTVETVQ